MTQIPTIGTYRGVELHDHQDEDRLAIVRAEIDAVFELQERTNGLVAWAEDRGRSPESRLLAEALVRAQCEAAAENRRTMPGVDLAHLRAVTAGLDGLEWRDPVHFDTLIASGPAPGVSNAAVRRPQPIG